MIAEATAAPVAVARSRGLFARLVPPAIAAVVVRVWLASYDRVPSVDETSYLEVGRNIWAGRGLLGAEGPETHFPPLVPFVLGGVARIVRDEHLATLLVSSASGVAVLLPLGFLTRRIAGTSAAVAGAWIAALAPALTWHLLLRGGGSEMLYTLLVLSAVAFVAVFTHGRLAVAVAGGLATGLAYLARPEALQVGLVLGLFVVLSALLASRSLRSAVVAGAAFAVPVAVCVLPYAAYLRSETGSWQVTGKALDVSLSAWRAVAEDERERRERELHALDETGLEIVEARYPLTTLIRQDPRGYLSLVGVNVGRLARAYLVPSRTWVWDLLPAPVLVLAAWGAWRYRRERTTLLLVAGAAMVLVTPVLFFALPRYATPATTIACGLAGAGLVALPRAFRAPAAAAAGTLLAFSLVAGPAGQDWSFRSLERVEQRDTGEWLAANTRRRTPVVTRNKVVAFYARRPQVMLPHAPLEEVLRYARHQRAEYLVVDAPTRPVRPLMAPLYGRGPWAGLELLWEHRVDRRVSRVFRILAE